uniref:Uncharacterized protein n=1 Tax=Pan troglodytes TaxID=9598 RepID=A0A2I3SFL3_PANTR
MSYSWRKTDNECEGMHCAGVSIKCLEAEREKQCCQDYRDTGHKCIRGLSRSIRDAMKEGHFYFVSYQIHLIIHCNEESVGNSKSDLSVPSTNPSLLFVSYYCEMIPCAYNAVSFK